MRSSHCSPQRVRCFAIFIGGKYLSITEGSKLSAEEVIERYEKAGATMALS